MTAAVQANAEGRITAEITNMLHAKEAELARRCIQAGMTERGQGNMQSWMQNNTVEIDTVTGMLNTHLQRTHKAFARRDGVPSERAGQAWAHAQGAMSEPWGLQRVLKTMKTGVSGLTATPEHVIHGGAHLQDAVQALVQHCLCGASPSVARRAMEHPSCKDAARLRPLMVMNMMCQISDQVVHEAASAAFECHGNDRAAGGLRGRRPNHAMMKAEIAMDYATHTNTPLACGVADASAAYNSCDPALLGMAYSGTGCPPELASTPCDLATGHTAVVKTAAGAEDWSNATTLHCGLPQGGHSSGDGLAAMLAVQLRMYDDAACERFKITVTSETGKREVEITTTLSVDDENPHLGVPLQPNHRVQPMTDNATLTNEHEKDTGVDECTLYTDWSSGKIADGEVPTCQLVNNHDLHSAQTDATATRSMDAPPGIAGDFWMWLHWGKPRGKTGSDYYEGPGWHLCYATGTKQKQGVPDKAEMHWARYPAKNLAREH